MLPKADHSDETVSDGPLQFAKLRGSEKAYISLISTDLSIVGNLTTEGELQIDGTIVGDIDCHKLTVGESAVVSGAITADEIEVRGKVEGRISARQVHLTKTAQVLGDIQHDILSIEAGAYLDSHCRRNNDKEA